MVTVAGGYFAFRNQYFLTATYAVFMSVLFVAGLCMSKEQFWPRTSNAVFHFLNAVSASGMALLIRKRDRDFLLTIPDY